jgi:hypothetical protein
MEISLFFVSLVYKIHWLSATKNSTEGQYHSKKRAIDMVQQANKSLRNILRNIYNTLTGNNKIKAMPQPAYARVIKHNNIRPNNFSRSA